MWAMKRTLPSNIYCFSVLLWYVIVTLLPNTEIAAIALDSSTVNSRKEVELSITKETDISGKSENQGGEELGGVCYILPPKISDLAVTILCPHCETLSGCLGEYTVGLCDRTVAMLDTVAISCHGTLLESTTTKAVRLCQVQQQRSTVRSDHPRILNEQMCDSLSITNEGGESGGRDDLEHGWFVIVGGSLSPRCS